MSGRQRAHVKFFGILFYAIGFLLVSSFSSFLNLFQHRDWRCVPKYGMRHADALVCAEIFGCSMILTSTGLGGYCYNVLCPRAPEGSTGSGSGLKRLRRWGHCLKSHPISRELGIKLGTPGYKASSLYTTPKLLFVAFQGSNQYRLGVYDLCFYFMTGAQEGSPKVVYGEADNRNGDSWFTRHRLIP